MEMNITLNEDQVDKVLYIMQREVYQTEQYIERFRKAGNNEAAEFFEQTLKDETRIFNSILKQFQDGTNNL